MVQPWTPGFHKGYKEGGHATGVSAQTGLTVMDSKNNTRDIVQQEAMLWGDAAEGYFSRAEACFEKQWKTLIEPFLFSVEVDTSCVLELAAGRGRNTAKLSSLCDRVLAVDVNPENIAFLRQRFQDTPNVAIIHNSGTDLADIPDDSVSLVYCFDSMVHFDIEIIIPYLKEFARILRPGGLGFCHHSNYTDGPGKDFRDNPHWRNFMSKNLFHHLCRRSGLDVLKQQVFDWSGEPELDCFTLFTPGAGEKASES